MTDYNSATSFLLLFMKFSDYYSFKSVVRQLASMRIHLATNRHGLYFYWRRFDLDKCFAPETLATSDISALLPPRRQWKRAKRSDRREQSPEDIARNSIIRVVLGHLKEGDLETYSWGKELLRFTNEIRDTFEIDEIHLSSPELHLIRKTSGRRKVQDQELQKKAFRCLASYKSGRDRVILACAAKYIRDLVDPYLLPCCYGFRKDSELFSYSTAVSDLRKYRVRHQGRPLYVAECDIQKFFDVLNHDVVLKAFDFFMERVTSCSPDPRARKIVTAYLDSYSLDKNLRASTVPEVVENRDYVERVSEEDLREAYKDTSIDPSSLPLGLPQGGALSPLLANLVMDAVDRSILSMNDPDLFYARYCDDMIIVHPNKDICQQALKRYLGMMDTLHLPVHPIEKGISYGREFYECKSKEPYCWNNVPVTKDECTSPWVSFLGHQIRYNGDIRVRKTTLKKHQEKLAQETTRLKIAIERSHGKCRQGLTPDDVLHSFEMRLMASGVGRIKEYESRYLSPCWLSAFRGLLSRDPVAERQLKSLDATREREIRRAQRYLEEGVSKDTTTPNEGKNTAEKAPKSPIEYYGAPYSYYGVFKELTLPSGESGEGSRLSGSDIFPIHTIGYSDL